MTHSSFLEKVSLAVDCFHTEYFAECIDLLEQAFAQELPDDLTADNFNAFFDALEVIEMIVEELEIRLTPFVKHTLGNLRDAMELLLEGETDYLDWNLLKGFQRLLYALKEGLRLLEKKRTETQQNKNIDIENTKFFLAIEQGEEQKLNISIVVRAPFKIAPIQSLSAEQLASIMQDFEQKLTKAAQEPQLIEELFSLAIQHLCLQGYYKESITCLEKLSNQFPKVEARCKHSIGINYFYSGDYKMAVKYYVEAWQAGYHLVNSEYNIAEACCKIIQNTDSLEEQAYWKNYFYSLFPESKEKIVP